LMFLVFYLAAFLLPGLLLTGFFGFDRARTCVAVALSLSILLLTLAAARSLGLGPVGFALVLAGIYIGGAGLLWVYRDNGAEWPGFALRLSGVHAVPAAVVVGVIGYLVWAGPYLEVPADAWWHLDKINEALASMAAGSMGTLDSPAELLEKDNHYWHTIAAFFILLGGLGMEEALPYLAFANSVLFCIAVYSFALLLFDELETDPVLRHLMAAASVVLFVAQFGISIFSYARYYVFAPALLNYLVFFAAVVCVMEFLRRDRRAYQFLIVGLLLSVVAAMNHFQEAVFIAVMSGTVLLVGVVHYVRGGSSAIGYPFDGESSRSRTLFLFLLLAAGYLVMHLFAYWTLERENPTTHALLADIRDYLPFLQNLYVLKPTGQFYGVITVWGVLVYALFWFGRKRFMRSPYLVAGMVVPVLTVFNPVFTDFFLRFAGPEVLWRVCYIIPLPFIGAYFLVRGLYESVQLENPGRMMAGVAVSAALVALLLPIRSVYFVAPHSKVYTLAPVPEGNSHELWSDLFEFLEGMERSGVITDQVTGYVINGLTRHKYRGYKFYSKFAPHVSYPVYDGPFRDRNGWKRLVKKRRFEAELPWIVVLNRRDGDLSVTGRYGGHWPEDVMHVSDYYSDAFIGYIREERDMFRKIWARDRIEVYKVTGT